uniref:Major facilitator superfamily (MFS) profile domain-containing protein n=1 Tax=Strigamia maritima TaxID=126957 RepID=T1JHG5_STRMM
MADKPTTSIEKENRLVNIITNITVEPAIFLHFVGLLMANVMDQSLIVHKVCIHRMNLSEEACRNLTDNETEQEEAQKYAANFMMFKTIMDTLPSIFWGLFIGSWSDKFGRKFLLTVPNIGAGVAMLLLALTAYKTEWDENYLLLSSTSFALTGSMLVMDTGVMSYIADITTPEKRTLRYGIVASALLCGAPVGTILGGQLFKFFNKTYEPVFLFGAGILFLNALYTFTTFIKKRKNNDRKHLFILLLTVGVSFMPTYAKNNLRFMYTRLKFDWDEVVISNYSTIELVFNFLAKNNLTFMYTRLKFDWDEVVIPNYSTIELVFNFLGLMLVLPLLKKLFKWQDITIGVVSAIAKIISEVFIGVSVKGWMLFAASPLYLIAGLTSVIIRTMISKIVTSSEQGKISSVLNVCEAIAPIIGSIILNQIYNATVGTDFKGAIYMVTASLSAFPILVLIYIS